MSGDTFWHKNKRFNKAGINLLPYKFSTIDMRQREIFVTAKALKNQGLLQIVYERGENWFVKTFENPDICDLTCLSGGEIQ
jgi:hypothetical protein